MLAIKSVEQLAKWIKQIVSTLRIDFFLPQSYSFHICILSYWSNSFSPEPCKVIFESMNVELPQFLIRSSILFHGWWMNSLPWPHKAIQPTFLILPILLLGHYPFAWHCWVFNKLCKVLLNKIVTWVSVLITTSLSADSLNTCHTYSLFCVALSQSLAFSALLIVLFFRMLPCPVAP